MSSDWGPWLEARFPAYLYPAADVRAVPVEVVRGFLARLGGRRDHLELLTGAALVAGGADALREFAWRSLPDLIRCLPSQTEVVRRRWEGGFHGRLDVRGTLAERLAGHRTRFVTRARERHFELPESILVASTARRMRDLLARLGAAKVLSGRNWAAPVLDVERQLTLLLTGTVLRDVPEEPLDARHERAAGHARHPAYKHALRWHRDLRWGLEHPEPHRLERLLAEGALAPVDADRRFELAVLLRLLEGCVAWAEAAQPGRWQVEHGLVCAHRDEVASLTRDDGARVDLYFDQATLPSGPRELGVERYLGRLGRMRPDVSVRVRGVDGSERWMVVEVKLSDDPGYWRQGFSEAVIYRHEYAAHLTGWPKAVLVYSGPTVSQPHPGDDVVAVGWDTWAPEILVQSLFEMS